MHFFAFTFRKKAKLVPSGQNSAKFPVQTFVKYIYPKSIKMFQLGTLMYQHIAYPQLRYDCCLTFTSLSHWATFKVQSKSIDHMYIYNICIRIYVYSINLLSFIFWPRMYACHLELQTIWRSSTKQFTGSLKESCCGNKLWIRQPISTRLNSEEDPSCEKYKTLGAQLQPWVGLQL